MSPRAKLLALAALFAAPIVASVIAYNVIEPRATANYGELLLPPAQITTQRLDSDSGGAFAFGALAGKWVMVASDSGECAAACRDKLEAMRQVRLALGREAGRVERVFVVDDLRRPDAGAMEEFSGTRLALTPRGLSLPAGAANDRAHVYLVDPRGNVMLRWPAGADRKRMLGDLKRLLKASQIG
jgi:cytochrome oxidase Cu insertion factor (SCO1/SenC/PrrC family)